MVSVTVVRLLGAGDVREIAGRLGLRPTKRFGQNFVIEPGTVRQIAALAAPRPADVILEVGPGLGSLTLALLEAIAQAETAAAGPGAAAAGPGAAAVAGPGAAAVAGPGAAAVAGPGAAARLVAVEIDPVLAAELPRTIAGRAPALADRVDVVAADALAVRGPAQGGGSVVLPGAPPAVLAANLPYNVAVPVVLHLLTVFPSLGRGVVMVQAEVADRMCAGPGGRVYGAPSAKLAWFAAARPAGTVPRTVFWPVPNVDSRLVSFTRRAPPATSASREEVFGVIDAAFGQRRKTLRAALAGWAGSPDRAERLLRAAGVDPGARGEALSVAEFARIAQARATSGAVMPGTK